jgi:hypothetical protein
MKGFKALDWYENVYLEEQSNRLFRQINGQMVPFKQMEHIQEYMPHVDSIIAYDEYIFDYVYSEGFYLIRFTVACLHKLGYSFDEVMKIMFAQYDAVNGLHKSHLTRQAFAMGVSHSYKAMDRMIEEQHKRN